jgi:hypothetical protein
MKLIPRLQRRFSVSFAKAWLQLSPPVPPGAAPARCSPDWWVLALDLHVGKGALASVTAQRDCQSVPSLLSHGDLRAPRGLGVNRRIAVPLRQDALELDTRGDVELGEDLAQVVFGRARADEEAGADLGV